MIELLLVAAGVAWFAVFGRHMLLMHRGNKLCDSLDAVADALDATPVGPCACSPDGCRDHHDGHRRFGLLVAQARAADGFGCHHLTGAVRPGALAELAALTRRAEELRARVEHSRLTAEAVAALGVEVDAADTARRVAELDAGQAEADRLTADLDRLAGSLTPAEAAALAGPLQRVRADLAGSAVAVEGLRRSIDRAAPARNADPVGRPRPAPRVAHYRRRLAAVHHADDPDAGTRRTRGPSRATFAKIGGTP